MDLSVSSLAGRAQACGQHCFQSPHQGERIAGDPLNAYTDVCHQGRPQDLVVIPRVQVPDCGSGISPLAIHFETQFLAALSAFLVKIPYCLCLGVCPPVPSFGFCTQSPTTPGRWPECPTGPESFPSTAFYMCVTQPGVMAGGAEEEGVDVVFSDPCSATRLTGAGPWHLGD